MGGPHNEITTSCKEMGAVTTLFRLFLRGTISEFFNRIGQKRTDGYFFRVTSGKIHIATTMKGARKRIA
jgi:hypothetical protein